MGALNEDSEFKGSHLKLEVASVNLVADRPWPLWWPSFNQVGITECSLYNVREEIQWLRDIRTWEWLCHEWYGQPLLLTPFHALQGSGRCSAQECIAAYVTERTPASLRLWWLLSVGHMQWWRWQRETPDGSYQWGWGQVTAFIPLRQGWAYSPYFPEEKKGWSECLRKSFAWFMHHGVLRKEIDGQCIKMWLDLYNRKRSGGQKPPHDFPWPLV